MVQNLELPKSVKRVTFLRNAASTGDNAAAPAPEVWEPKKEGKKQTRGFRLFGKWTRRSSEALGEFSRTYLDRHDRSNAKRRDGWLRDYTYNMTKANRSAIKKLRIPFVRV